MKTFFLIINQIIKNDVPDSNSPAIFFQIFLNTPYTTKDKFDFYNKTNHNLFVNDIMKERFNEMFFKIQRTYYAFNRLKNVFLFKYAKSNANRDMELNEIVEGGKHVICIYHKNGKYLFKVNDLLKIINNSLTNSHLFFAEPLAVKNPYNNLPFDKSNLYNIYFFVKFNTSYKADLFEKYFAVNFNLTEFYQQHEFLLREHIIKTYINESTNSHLRKHLDNMINEFNKLHTNMKFKIDSKFPDHRLVTIMKPYLTLYMISLYSLVASIRTNSFAKLKYKLTQFYKYNPSFGRKIVVISCLQYKASPSGINIAKKMKPFIKKYVFNDKHIDYFKTENETFFENHKTIKSLYNVRINLDQPSLTTNMYLILDDPVSNSDDDVDDDADDDADDEVDHQVDVFTQDEVLEYDYNYEFNYTYHYGN